MRAFLATHPASLESPGCALLGAAVQRAGGPLDRQLFRLTPGAHPAGGLRPSNPAPGRIVNSAPNHFFWLICHLEHPSRIGESLTLALMFPAIRRLLLNVHGAPLIRWKARNPAIADNAPHIGPGLWFPRPRPRLFSKGRSAGRKE